MSSKDQKLEARAICKEFLELNRYLKIYDGSLKKFFNSKQRRHLTRHGLSSKGFGSGKGKFTPLKEARKLV